MLNLSSSSGGGNYIRFMPSANAWLNSNKEEFTPKKMVVDTASLQTGWMHLGEGVRDWQPDASLGKKGAQPSPSIHNYLVSEKIIDAKKTKITNISKKKQKEITDAKTAAAAQVAASAKAAAALPEGQASLAPEGRETPKEEVKPEEKPA